MNRIDQVIKDTVQDYYAQRKLTFPTSIQALLFLVSEVGEIADAEVDKMGDWVRNNERTRDEAEEVADVFFMLYVYAIAKGIDPMHEMLKKMMRKSNED